LADANNSITNEWEGKYLIKISPGVYDLGGGVELKRNVDIEGSGPENTFLTNGGFSFTYWAIETNAIKDLTLYGAIIAHNSNLVISNLIIYSNGGHGIYGEGMKSVNLNNVIIYNSEGLGLGLYVVNEVPQHASIINTIIYAGLPLRFAETSGIVNIESSKFVSNSPGNFGMEIFCVNPYYPLTVNINGSTFDLAGGSRTAVLSRDQYASANISNSKIYLKDGNGNLDPNAIVGNSPVVKIANTLISGGQKNTYKSIFNYDENYTPLANQ